MCTKDYSIPHTFPAHAGLISGVFRILFLSKYPYILHPTQIPNELSIHIKNRQIEQIKNGRDPRISKTNVTINIKVARNKPIDHANLF